MLILPAAPKPGDKSHFVVAQGRAEQNIIVGWWKIREFVSQISTPNELITPFLPATRPQRYCCRARDYYKLHCVVGYFPCKRLAHPLTDFCEFDILPCKGRSWIIKAIRPRRPIGPQSGIYESFLRCDCNCRDAGLAHSNRQPAAFRSCSLS